MKPSKYNYKDGSLPRSVLTNIFTPVSTDNYKERISYDANGNIQTYLRNNEIGAVKNNYSYAYTSGRNKLSSITNSVNSKTKTYNYDAIGNTTEDGMQGITNAVWNVYGKLQSLVNKNEQSIVYNYSSDGQRINKKVGSTEEWYVRDAGGNIMAAYIKDPGVNNGKLTTQGYEMYGSTAIGTWEKHKDVETEGADNNERVLTRGEQKIRFSNHLGNTMLVLSDIKRQVQSPENPSQIAGYEPVVLNATDYSAYGESLIGREFNSTVIKYGFNGKLNDNDLGYQDYGMRLSSVKKRGFLSVDPLAAKFPFYSPYQFAGNMPIRYIDLDGAEPAEPGIKNGEIQTGTNGNSDVAKSWIWDGKRWNESHLQELIVTAKRKYVPEQDFVNNPLTRYNSKSEPSYKLSNTATTKSFLIEFGQNWKCKSCHNTIIVGGELLNEVKGLGTVQQLFRKGVEALYDKEKGFTPGATFVGNYRMSDLNGPDGDRMKRQVLEDLLNGKPITNSRLFSAEFFLGSFGFSMRVTNDGKNMVITVYDSKTIQSATDGGKELLKQLWPLEENTAPTYQRYFWVIPIEEVINAYKESMISEYKSRD